MALRLRKTDLTDFPGGPVVKNLPANAGGMGLIPSRGRFHILQSNQACTPQLLSLHALELVLCSKRNHCSEKPSLKLLELSQH